MDKFELQQQGDATLLRKKHPNLYLDLSSIAKGFGVDAVAQVLEDAGIPDYLVEIGGEIRSAGKSPTGEPWRIAIEQPRAAAPSASNHRPAASRLGNIGRLPQFPPRRKRQHAHAFNQPPHAATRAQQHRLAVGNCPHQHGGRRLGNGPDHIGQTHWLWRGKSIWPFASLSGGTARCTRPTQTNSQRLSSQNKHLPHQPCRRAGLFVAPIPHQNK